MPKPRLILDQHFRRLEEPFTPAAYARLCERTDVLGGQNWPMDRARLLEALPGATFLVAAHPTLSAAELAGAPELRAVIEVAGGFNRGLDYHACFERGIEVLSSMPGFRFAVAEMAVGMILAGARGLVAEHEAFRSGREHWLDDMPGRDFSLFGQSVGFVGYGRIARECHRLLAPFGPVVRAFDPWLDPSDPDLAGVELASLERVVERSKVLVVAASPTDENWQMLDRDLIRTIPDGGLVVVISRTHPVDFPALVAEATTGRITLATDVYPSEPLAPDHPLRRLPNVILSPHRAAAVPGGRHPIGDMIVHDIEAVLDGRPERRLKRADPERVWHLANARASAP